MVDKIKKYMLKIIISLLVGGFIGYIIWVYYWIGKLRNPYFNKPEIKHDWKFVLMNYDEENHKEYKMLQCKACQDIKREYTGRVYGQNKCEFCDSLETTKHSAEGKGDVYLCEECRSRGSGESSDL